jgi:AraC family transcriptional activator of tynA and feaB
MAHDIAVCWRNEPEDAWVGGCTLDVFSTASVPRSARTTYWNDMYSRRFAQVTFNPVDREGFEAELRMGAVGPISIARVHSKPTDIERTRSHISRSDRRIFSFLLQVRGHAVFTHYGHESHMEEGDFTLCDNAVPHRLACSAGTELIIVRTSPEVLRSYLPMPEQLCGLRLPASKGMTSTAANMAQRLWSLVEGGLPEKFSAMIARNLLDTMATSYAIAFDTSLSESAAVSARKSQAKRYIEAHLRDPDLTPCSVAKALGISPRYLRMLFSGTEESLSRYILRRRLEECAKQLSSVLWNRQTITEIAFACGFNSAAHFTRAFRDEYGMTPSQYRRAQLAKSTAHLPAPSAVRLT